MMTFMRDRMRSSSGFLYFVSMWALCATVAGLGTYAAGGDFSGGGVVGKALGPGFFFAAITTSARRKRNGRGPTRRGE
jgi:hypothetical protein